MKPLRSMARLTLLLPALLTGCALFAPPPLTPGQSEAEVLSAMGRQPTGRYPMADGVTRLEFATGPSGRMTWMVDIGPDGRSRWFDQVLNARHFAEFAQQAPGMSADEVLRALGRPGERTGGGLRGGQTWSWRYPTNDCLWFQVSIEEDGKASGAGYGIDWSCDAGAEHARAGGRRGGGGGHGGHR
jgi:hypothetical protein